MKKLWELIKSPGAMALLAIFSIAFAIFQLYYEKKPELLVKVEAASSVFSVFQPVGGLEVSYAGQDLRVSKQSLWVVTASISNSGEAVIRKDDYDDLAPLSVYVSDGKIVEAPAVTSENSYLEENLKPVVESNRIVFSPVIIEPQDAFRLRILVLGPEGKTPSLKLSAKIAGLHGISYATPDSPNASKSAWEMVTQADALWVHPARAVVYFFGGLLLLMLTAMVGSGIGSIFFSIGQNREKIKRRNSLTGYRQGENMNWEDRALNEMYIERGEEVLREIKKLIYVSKSRLALIERVKPVNDDGKLDVIIKSATPFYSSRTLDELKDRELLLFDGFRPVWANGFESSLSDLCTFLGLEESAKDDCGERHLRTVDPVQSIADVDRPSLELQSNLER